MSRPEKSEPELSQLRNHSLNIEQKEQGYALKPEKDVQRITILNRFHWENLTQQKN